MKRTNHGGGVDLELARGERLAEVIAEPFVIGPGLRSWVGPHPLASPGRSTGLEGVTLLEALRAPSSSDTSVRRRQLATRAVVVLSAIGGAFAGGHPAGVRVVDVVSSGVLAGVVAVLRVPSCTMDVDLRGRHRTARVGATRHAVPRGCGGLRRGGRQLGVEPAQPRALGAVLGALAIQILLRLPAWGPFGLPSLLALVAIVPVLVFGLRPHEATDATTVRGGLARAARCRVRRHRALRRGPCERSRRPRRRGGGHPPGCRCRTPR